MEITGVSPQRGEYALSFTAPIEDRAEVVMELSPESDGRTTLSWRMHGELDFMGRAMEAVVGMDGMIGPDFERGLQMLEERLDADRAAAPDPGDADLDSAGDTTTEP
jgi:hypothetical protein